MFFLDDLEREPKAGKNTLRARLDGCATRCGGVDGDGLWRKDLTQTLEDDDGSDKSEC